MDGDGHELYDLQIAAIRRTVVKTAAGAVPAIKLAEAVGEALTDAKPKARYLAGAGAREAVALSRTPSDRIKDMAIAKEVGLPDPE